MQGIQRLLRLGWQFRLGSKTFVQFVVSLVSSVQPKLGCDRHVEQVKSHSDMAEAQSAEEAWHIADNGHADSFAKAANMDREEETLSLHALAHREYAHLGKRMKAVHTLQSKVLLHFSSARPVQLQRASTMPSLQCQNGISLSVPLDDFSDSMLCPPFLDVLARYIQASKWYNSGQPCPLRLAYIQLVADTGWLVPLNIAGWDSHAVPKQWQCALTVVYCMGPRTVTSASHVRFCQAEY